MSLYALPVTVTDLTQLQQGIEFSTDTNEAMTEVGLINPPTQSSTVYSYAQQLLANNISLSQVAMADYSFMLGITPSVTELTKLTRGFLPGQVQDAVTNNFNPTVFAAEALGKGLADQTAFQTFTSLSVSEFAKTVSTATGVNASAIQGFVQNWVTFYTAHPDALQDLTITQASYGAAFGDAVGVALLNPTVNATLALLVSEEQNALIDNAEGLYQVGIPLIEEPPHLPLQGEAVQIPNAGGSPYGHIINWAAQFGAADYAQFVAPAQSGFLTIENAPSIFTVNVGHYATGQLIVEAAGNNGLCTFILGDSTGSGNFVGGVVGYSTVHIVANGSGTQSIAGFVTGAATNSPIPSDSNLVISGSGALDLGSPPGAGQEGFAFVYVPKGITDDGVSLSMGEALADTIDASNAPVLSMNGPACLVGTNPFPGPVSGVDVFGGTSGNTLQGSLGLGAASTVTFSNGKTGVTDTFIGADHIQGGSGGGDFIYGDGGPDTIFLPTHSQPDAVVFGEDFMGSVKDVLAITDGSDVAYPGYWGASATKIPIPSLFSGSTGGTSTGMTTITGFNLGGGGDVLEFGVAAWNGASTGSVGHALKGDLVGLTGLFPVPTGAATLSPVWASSSSNGLLTASENMLLYAPSGVTETNAQQLAAQLHTSSGAIVLPGAPNLGYIPPGQDLHILVAYDASAGSAHAVNIADVDLVNTTSSNQSSTANLNVYASDMVHLTGVSLASLTSANINFV
jgi:hypothetical protein